MSLNKFSDVNTGVDLKLNIGCEDLKVSDQMEIDGSLQTAVLAVGVDPNITIYPSERGETGQIMMTDGVGQNFYRFQNKYILNQSTFPVQNVASGVLLNNGSYARLGNFSMPDIELGRSYHMRVCGQTQISVPSTLRFRIFYDDQLIADTTPTTMPAILSQEGFVLEADITFRSAVSPRDVASTIVYTQKTDAPPSTGILQTINNFDTTSVVTTGVGKLEIVVDWGTPDINNHIYCLSAVLSQTSIDFPVIV